MCLFFRRKRPDFVLVVRELKLINERLFSMSQEIQALRELVIKTIADVNAKLEALVASSTSLSDEDKAAIASMTEALTALDAQVKPPVPTPVAEPAIVE